MPLNTGIFSIAPGEQAKDVDWRRRLAAQLITQGTDTSPVQAWSEGAARLANALVGTMEFKQADEIDRRRQAAFVESLKSLPGLEPEGPGPSAALPQAAPSAGPNMPIAPNPVRTASLPPPMAPAGPSGPAINNIIGMEPGQPQDPYRTRLDQMRPPQAQIAQALRPPAPAGQPTMPPSPTAGPAAPPMPAPGMPGQPTPATAPATRPGTPIVPPEIRERIRTYMGSPDHRLQALGMQLYAEYATPKDPTFGTIGQGQYGEPQHGWIDSRNQTITKVPGSGVPFETSMKLRKEVSDLPSYKALASVAPVYKSMLEAAPRNTRAADINLIYGLVKIMDPNTGVKEGETKMAEAIATLPQYLQATITSQLESTGRLLPETREAIMQEAYSRMNAHKELFDQDTRMYHGIATRAQINPQDVLPIFGPFAPYQKPAVPGATPQTKVINGKTYTQRPDGQWETK
jgi:hypothetical protein